jgi:thiol-disulfide isomerase/thioredoxin
VPDAGMTIQLLRNPVPVSDLRFTDLDGHTLTTADLRGKVTLINFWATWCGPCRMEIPDLIKLQEQYKDHVQVIGVSVDEGPVEEVRQFAMQFRINYPIVMTSREINRQFSGMMAIPTSFVIDPKARIVQTHVGLISASVIEQETRYLASLPANVTVERIEDTKQTRLMNAAHATELPGVDLSRLTPKQKATALQRLNEESCPCGCQLTVAQCRINDTSCGISLPIAEEIVTQVAAN